MENKVYFVKGISNDPRFNLASEEYLLKQKEGRYIYLWQNAPSVIVGVNQNTAEEVNFVYTEANGISVVRRQTGGGAVYHDLKNVCYTVIDKFDAERDNYRYFTSGIIGYLKTLGVNAEFSGRNDVVIDGKKISGNAQCVYKNIIMHHGTLLFDTDKEALQNALKPHKFKVESKGIKSIRARVTNISEHLATPLTVEEFMGGLSLYLSDGAEEYTFTEEDIKAINELVKTKYSTFEWNVGSSPKSQFFSEEKFDFGIVKVCFNVLEGKLQDVTFSGDFFSNKQISALNHALNGVLYNSESVLKALKDVSDYIVGSTPQKIFSLFFK